VIIGRTKLSRRWVKSNQTPVNAAAVGGAGNDFSEASLRFAQGSGYVAGSAMNQVAL
jgi:hypothetical protein